MKAGCGIGVKLGALFGGITFGGGGTDIGCW